MAGVLPRKQDRTAVGGCGERNGRDAQGNVPLGKDVEDVALHLLIADRRRIVETKADRDHSPSLVGVEAFENTTTPMPSTTVTLAGFGHGGWLRAYSRTRAIVVSAPTNVASSRIKRAMYVMCCASRNLGPTASRVVNGYVVGISYRPTTTIFLPSQPAFGSERSRASTCVSVSKWANVLR